MPPRNAIEPVDYAENEGEKPYRSRGQDKPPISLVKGFLGESEGLNHLGVRFQPVGLQTVSAHRGAADGAIGLPSVSGFHETWIREPTGRTWLFARTPPLFGLRCRSPRSPSSPLLIGWAPSLLPSVTCYTASRLRFECRRERQESAGRSTPIRTSRNQGTPCDGRQTALRPNGGDLPIPMASNAKDRTSPSVLLLGRPSLPTSRRVRVEHVEGSRGLRGPPGSHRAVEGALPAKRGRHARRRQEVASARSHPPQERKRT